MTEDVQPGVPPKPDFLKTARPWADTFSKSVAGIAVAVYACGFLVVSLYHAKFGFVGTNLLRPRVLAAGTWFVFFTAIPTSLSFQARKSSWLGIANEAYFLWLGCLFSSWSLSYLIFVSSPYQTYRPYFRPFGKWYWILTILFSSAVILLNILQKKEKGPKWVLPLLSILLVLYSLWEPIRSFLNDDYFNSSTVAVWFFGAFLLVKLELNARSGRNLWDSGEWAKPLVTFCALLLAFSLVMYPHLKASWGGGTPEDVTVYFSKDSLLSPDKAVQAQLIEESDDGFYLVGPNESRAIFVPRSAVALIYFADKPGDSHILQNLSQPSSQSKPGVNQ